MSAARSRLYFLLFLISCLAPAAAVAKDANSSKAGIRITTKSAEARAYFEEGLAKYQTLHLQVGLANWRKAVQADPQFALAHIFLANFSDDPAEQVAEREKALANRNHVSEEERL